MQEAVRNGTSQKSKGTILFTHLAQKEGGVERRHLIAFRSFEGVASVALWQKAISTGQGKGAEAGRGHFDKRIEPRRKKTWRSITIGQNPPDPPRRTGFGFTREASGAPFIGGGGLTGSDCTRKRDHNGRRGKEGLGKGRGREAERYRFWTTRTRKEEEKG